MGICDPLVPLSDLWAELYVCVCVQLQTLLLERGCVDRGVIPWRLCVFSAAPCWPFKSKLEAMVGESAKRPPPQSPPTLLMSKAACDAEWGIHILGCLCHTHSLMRIALWFEEIFKKNLNGLVTVTYVFFNRSEDAYVKRRWAETRSFKVIILINTRPDWLTHKYTTRR